MRSGNGKLEYDGCVYEGEFEFDMFDGKGSLHFKEIGKVYEGEFSKNLMSGDGVMILPDESRYEGQFKNGMFSG
jgi:hypothetical protein